MLSKKLPITLGVIVVILIIISVFLYRYFGINQSGLNSLENLGNSTRSEVPANTVVPGVGQQLGSGIAAPVSVTQAAPGVSAKLRTFAIKAESDVFNPSTIIAKVGDTAHINFTAIDKDYDITFPDYGMKQSASAGQTKVLEFQAINTGKFTYYCSSCGGLNSKTIGYIIIAP